MATVAAYSDTDPLQVPIELLSLLGRFDGRPTELVLDEIEQEVGIRLDPDLVRKLTDFELLIPA